MSLGEAHPLTFSRPPRARSYRYDTLRPGTGCYILVRGALVPQQDKGGHGAPSGAGGAGSLPPLAPSAAASAAASAPTPRRSASTGLLRRGSSVDAPSVRSSVAEMMSPGPPSKSPVKAVTAEQVAADPVAAAAADRRNLISTAVDAVGAALSAWSVGVSEAGSLLGLECFVGPPLPPTMESCGSSLLLHLSPAALAAALAAALPPRLIEYLQREWTLTHLAKSAALDGVSRERLLNPYDGRTAGFAALKWGGITRACVFFCQDKSEPNRIRGGWLL